MVKKKVSKKTKTPKKVKKEVKVKIVEESFGKEVGKVTHYFSNIGVGVIKLSGTLKQGDKIRIKGATSDFTQKVDSMQIDHDKVEEAKKGKAIGMKVADHAREHDVVYKV